MSRYIDADVAIEQIARLKDNDSSGYDLGLDTAINEIKHHMPIENVVEIVSCKDCVFLEVLNSEHYYARCNWHGRLFPSFGNPDTRYYFCADCQRRE